MTQNLPQLDRPMATSVGPGRLDFELIIRAPYDINYGVPLSVEWEAGAMHRELGTAESCAYIKRPDFALSGNRAVDKAFDQKEQ